MYVNTLKSLRHAIKEKRGSLLSRSVMLLLDNASVHKANKVHSAPPNSLAGYKGTYF